MTKPFRAPLFHFSSLSARFKEEAGRRDDMAFLRARHPVEFDRAVQSFLDGAPAPDAAER